MLCKLFYVTYSNGRVFIFDVVCIGTYFNKFLEICESIRSYCLYYITVSTYNTVFIIFVDFVAPETNHVHIRSAKALNQNTFVSIFGTILHSLYSMRI